MLAGRVERGHALVVSQVINSRARLTELERRIKETEELEERLEAPERARVQKGGGRRCGGLKKRIEAQEKAIRDSWRAEAAEKDKAKDLEPGQSRSGEKKGSWWTSTTSSRSPSSTMPLCGARTRNKHSRLCGSPHWRGCSDLYQPVGRSRPAGNSRRRPAGEASADGGGPRPPGGRQSVAYPFAPGFLTCAAAVLSRPVRTGALWHAGLPSPERWVCGKS